MYGESEFIEFIPKVSSTTVLVLLKALSMNHGVFKVFLGYQTL